MVYLADISETIHSITNMFARTKVYDLSDYVMTFDLGLPLKVQ